MFAVEESGEADLAALLRVAEDDPPVLSPPRDLRHWHLQFKERVSQDLQSVYRMDVYYQKQIPIIGKFRLR